MQIQGLKILCQGFLSLSFRMRAACMGALAAMEQLQLRHGRRFPPAIADEFKRSYLIFRASLNALADHALSTRVIRYHVRPKLHQLGHLAMQFAPRSNPRYFHVYNDENMVGSVKKISEISHPVYVSRLAMQRYILHVCMLWAGEGAML